MLTKWDLENIRVHFHNLTMKPSGYTTEAIEDTELCFPKCHNFGRIKKHVHKI